VKQYRVTYSPEIEIAQDCVLSPDDPIHELKKRTFLNKFENFEVEEAEIIEDNESI